MSNENKRITIWFLCGIILSVYGVTIALSGIYNMFNPPPEVKVAHLHLDFWWGLVLLLAGGIFLWRQWPGKVGEQE